MGQGSQNLGFEGRSLRITWEPLTWLFDFSKGRKPTLILRTQLSVRVNAILGKCMASLVSSNPLLSCSLLFLRSPSWPSFFQACAGLWTEWIGDLMCPPLSLP